MSAPFTYSFVLFFNWLRTWSGKRGCYALTPLDSKSCACSKRTCCAWLVRELEKRNCSPSRICSLDEPQHLLFPRLDPRGLLRGRADGWEDFLGSGGPHSSNINTLGQTYDKNLAKWIKEKPRLWSLLYTHN